MNNYKTGALKRKLKMGKGDFEPGTMISKMNETKSAPKQKMPSGKTEVVAFLGMV